MPVGWNGPILRWRQYACVHFLLAICDHKQTVAELLDTVAKHRFIQKISVLSE